MIVRRVVVGAVLLVSFLVAAPAPARASLQDAELYLRRYIAEVRALGFELVSEERGVGWDVAGIAVGGTQEYEVELERNHTYAFIAIGCDESRDLDLYLYTPDGYLTESNEEDDDEPAFEYDCSESGTYVLRVQEFDAPDGRAHFGYAVLRRAQRQ